MFPLVATPPLMVSPVVLLSVMPVQQALHTRPNDPMATAAHRLKHLDMALCQEAP